MSYINLSSFHHGKEKELKNKKRIGGSEKGKGGKGEREGNGKDKGEKERQGEAAEMEAEEGGKLRTTRMELSS